MPEVTSHSRYVNSAHGLYDSRSVAVCSEGAPRRNAVVELDAFTSRQEAADKTRPEQHFRINFLKPKPLNPETPSPLPHFEEKPLAFEPRSIQTSNPAEPGPLIVLASDSFPCAHMCLSAFLGSDLERLKSATNQGSRRFRPLYLSTYLPLLSIYPSIYRSIYAIPIYRSIGLAIYQSVCLSICQAAYLSTYLSIYLATCQHV